MKPLPYAVEEATQTKNAHYVEIARCYFQRDAERICRLINESGHLARVVVDDVELERATANIAHDPE